MEGPLTNLKPSMAQLPVPKRRFDRGAFGAGGGGIGAVRYVPTDTVGGTPINLPTSSGGGAVGAAAGDGSGGGAAAARANGRGGAGASSSGSGYGAPAAAAAAPAGAFNPFALPSSYTISLPSSRPAGRSGGGLGAPPAAAGASQGLLPLQTQAGGPASQASLAGGGLFTQTLGGGGGFTQALGGGGVGGGGFTQALGDGSGFTQALDASQASWGFGVGDLLSQQGLRSQAPGSGLSQASGAADGLDGRL